MLKYLLALAATWQLAVAVAVVAATEEAKNPIITACISSLLRTWDYYYYY